MLPAASDFDLPVLPVHQQKDKAISAPHEWRVEANFKASQHRPNRQAHP
jgi:hypothetical protein